MVIPPIKKPKRKVHRYQKGDYESMRKDTLQFAKEKYFSGHSDTRSVQENFNLITSFIQGSADKHIPSKTSRSVSSVPWITPEIRRKIRKKNETHAKAKKTGSAKIRSKFETLRREIKADIRKQHDLQHRAQHNGVSLTPHTAEHNSEEGCSTRRECLL